MVDLFVIRWVHVCETLSVVVVRVRYVVRPGIQSGGGRRTRERDTSREGRTKLLLNPRGLSSTKNIPIKLVLKESQVDLAVACLAAGARERRRGWSGAGEAERVT